MSGSRIGHVVVAVPARDEERLVGACLDSVRVAADRLLAARPDVTVEVVLALDRCVDGTAAVAARHPVTLLAIDAGCVGVARREAVATGLSAPRARAADPRATWVANTDADCAVPPGWLTRQVALAESGTDLVVGTVVPVDVVDPAVLLAWRARHRLREGHGHVHGANLGVRAAAYLEAGGFAEVGLHEDVGLVTRVRDAGHPWVATDRVRVRTSGRSSSRVEGGFATYLAALGPAD
ncbi:glycosyltransferase [Phycicoccus duodecadis]|uniref:4,4'-diaponeurosporenoate glycosyltransferase n=1 Tax=Phycicoccus duodecadis TaxID=173053 RepID=A0A2N3YI79_9MICO|nr:glycosyltransferase family A protein [Phycicoccus duodecadis]PKW26555.1 glycosyl transferase family 2 [Phycicoccus duodecadis]